MPNWEIMDKWAYTDPGLQPYIAKCTCNCDCSGRCICDQDENRRLRRHDWQDEQIDDQQDGINEINSGQPFLGPGVG